VVVNDVFNTFLRRLSAILSVIIIGLGITVSGWAQLTGKGQYVEVAKGTKLCSNTILEQSRGTLHPGKVFWKVSSNVRANGTQSVSAFVLEAIYDRKTGDTKIRESRYDEEYATFFKRDPERKGILFMISPEDGKVEAMVEICSKKK
jgi:hypothetical protein